jgi:hypothetical protein
VSACAENAGMKMASGRMRRWFMGEYDVVWRGKIPSSKSQIPNKFQDAESGKTPRQPNLSGRGD